MTSQAIKSPIVQFQICLRVKGKINISAFWKTFKLLTFLVIKNNEHFTIHLLLGLPKLSYIKSFKSNNSGLDLKTQLSINHNFLFNKIFLLSFCTHGTKFEIKSSSLVSVLRKTCTLQDKTSEVKESLIYSLTAR